VPLSFVKVVAWRSGDELATAGFVLDQSPVLDLSEAARAAQAERERQRLADGAVAVPDLGPFRTFQVPVASVAALTGLVMPVLVEADRMARAGVIPPGEPPEGAGTAAWREVSRPAELLLEP
jgi:endonuclease G